MTQPSSSLARNAAADAGTASPSGAPSIILLVLITAVGPFALNLFVPSMPGLVTVFDTSPAVVQLTLTLYLIAVAVSQLVYGPVSDHLGRRPLLLFGLGLFVIANIVAVLAPNIETLILARVLQAVGGAASMVLTRAMLADLYGPAKAASMISYIIGGMAVAPMVAPLIGGYLELYFDWRAGFMLLIAMGASVLAIASLRLPETLQDKHHGRDPIAMLRSFGYLLRDPAFLGYAGFTAFAQGIFFAFLATAPYIMIDILGRPENEYGLYFMLAAILYVGGNWFSGRYSERIGIDRMIWIGGLITLFACALLVAIALAGHLNPITLFATLGIFSIGNGLSAPNGLAGAVGVAPRGAGGSASGLAGFLGMVLGALCSQIGGFVVDGAASATPTAILYAILAALSIGSHWMGVRMKRRKTGSNA